MTNGQEYVCVCVKEIKMEFAHLLLLRCHLINQNFFSSVTVETKYSCKILGYLIF